MTDNRSFRESHQRKPRFLNNLPPSSPVPPKADAALSPKEARELIASLVSRGLVSFDKPLEDNALRADYMREHRKSK
jgi:hypothetical protein